MSNAKENISDLSFMSLLLKILVDLSKNKKWIGIITLIFLVTMVSISLLLPEKFEAKATILPPSANNSSLKQMFGKMDGIAGLMGMNMGSSNSAPLLKNILSSKDFQEKIIKNFNLIHVYEFDKIPASQLRYADVLKSFRKNFKIEYDEDDEVIVITSRDESAQRAKNIVEFTVSILDSAYMATLRNQTSQNKFFYKTRLNSADSALASLQIKLAQFQKKTGVLEPKVQIENSVKLLGELEAQQIILNMQKEVEQKSVGSNTDRYKEIELKESMYKGKIADLLQSKSSQSLRLALRGNSLGDLDHYADLMREIKIQETLYSYLRQSYEELSLEESKNIKSIVIVEKPWLNNKRVSPPRTALVMAGLFGGVILSILFIVCLESFKRARVNQSQVFKGLVEIKNNLKLK